MACLAGEVAVPTPPQIKGMDFSVSGGMHSDRGRHDRDEWEGWNFFCTDVSSQTQAPWCGQAAAHLSGCSIAFLSQWVGWQRALQRDACTLMLQGGGVAVNNQKISNETHTLQEADLIDGRLILLAAGKKNKLLVRVEG
jgi:hypothetical protein